MPDDKPEAVRLPSGVDAAEYLAGLRREKTDQQGAGGDPARVRAIDAEIKSVEGLLGVHPAPEQDESTAAAHREKAVRPRRTTR